MDTRKLTAHKRPDRRTIIAVDGGQTIATAAQDGHEDAAELVRRWNCHTELLEALQVMLAHAALFNRDTDEAWVVRKEMAEAAIRNATQG